MSNIENIKILADVAHESGNYDQSYTYYSRVLEEEIENGLAWLRKGLAAANLTTSDKDMISEAKTLIERGRRLGVSDQERQDAIIRLKAAYVSVTKRLDDELLSKVKDYQKVGMPSGGSALLHMAGQSLNKTISAAGQAELRSKSLDLLAIICDLEGVASNYEYAILAIDTLKAQSKATGNFLTTGSTNIHGVRVDRLHVYMQTCLAKLRGEAPTNIGSTTSSLQIKKTANPADKKSSGPWRYIFAMLFWLFIISVILSKCSK